jgi:hypothetical protein
MDRQALLNYCAGELIAVKMELEKIAFLLQSGVRPTKEIKEHLDNMLDRKRLLEKLIEEIKNKK